MLNFAMALACLGFLNWKMMRMNAKVLMVVIAFVALVAATAGAQIKRERLQSATDEQLLREWVKVLSHDEFGGRKPMTPYEDKTVNYLARQLEVMGLEPAFDGSWFQPFEMISVTAKPVGAGFSVTCGATKCSLTINKLFK